METKQRTRRRVVVDDRPLATAIGHRIRAARLGAGLTQQALAGDRYTKAYISALENGVAKPSMAALNFLAGRLGMPSSAFLRDTETAWTRLEVDLRLAQGDFATAVEGYRDLLATDPARAEQAALLAGLSEALCRLDRGVEAIRPAAEAVAILHDLGRSTERLNALYWLAYGHHAAENHDEARARMLEVLEACRSATPVDAHLHVRALIALGAIEMGAGRTEAAVAYLREADGFADEIDGRRRATYLYTLAISYRKAGDHEAAIRAGTQSLALFRTAEAINESASSSNILALAYLEAGSLEQARTSALLARQIATTAGDERLLADIADTRARIELAAGDPDLAITLSDEGLEIAQRTANRGATLDAMVTKGRALIALDRPDVARALLAEAAALVPPAGSASRRREVLKAWADAVARAGDPGQAYEILRDAVATER